MLKVPQNGFTIGRGVDADIGSIEDPFMSLQQLSIYHIGGDEFSLTDTSKHGTWVTVSDHEPVRLHRTRWTVRKGD